MKLTFNTERERDRQTEDGPRELPNSIFKLQRGDTIPNSIPYTFFIYH